MANLYDYGHHLYTDNLFTSYQAVSCLLSKQTYLTGTMRRNQTWHLPEEIRKANPKIGEVVYYRQNKILAMFYRQKKSQNKPVLMLSTFKGAYSVPHRKKADQTIPAMVDSYNQCMGGVDSSDQVMYSYMSERKSRNWAKKVVFSLLTRLLMNSYISRSIPKPKKRIEFIKDMIDSLAQDFKTLRTQPAIDKPGVVTLADMKQLDCCVCLDCKQGRKGRKRARTQCTLWGSTELACQSINVSRRTFPLCCVFLCGFWADPLTHPPLYAFMLYTLLIGFKAYLVHS